MQRRAVYVPRLLGALTVAVAAACGGGGDKATAPGNSPATVTSNVATPASAVIASPINPTPSVVVKNSAGAPLANVRVTFVVTAGGGVVAGASKLTDATGIASVDSWTLGSTPGTNTLTATAGAKTATFTVTGTNTCVLSGGLTVGGTVTGNLSTSPCAAAGGTAAQSWSFQQPSGQTAVSFVMHPTGSPTFDTVLLLHRNTYAAFDRLIGFNDDDQTVAGGTTDSRVNAILGAGSYVISGNNFDAGVTGPFTITAEAWTGDIVNCRDAFITTGVTTNQTMTNSCNYQGTTQYVDPAEIYLAQGQQVQIDMTSTAFDPKLDLYLASGTPAGSDDNSGGGTSARIVYTAGAAGIFVIVPTAATASQVGAYTLSATSIAGGPVGPATLSAAAGTAIVKAPKHDGPRSAMPWQRQH